MNRYEDGMRFVHQAIIGLCSGGCTIAAGFMIERLFLKEWEWWMWGLAALPFLGMVLFSAWRLTKMESPVENLEKKLSRDSDRLRRAIAEPDEKKRAAILGYYEAKPVGAVFHVGRPIATAKASNE